MSTAMQTVELIKVDVQKLSAGYRSSKFVGSSVVNDANETIGNIADLLVSPNGKQPFAVLSIGGFLGMGKHLVVLPYDSLKPFDNKLMLPGGSKEGLRTLPTFTYRRSDPTPCRMVVNCGARSGTDAGRGNPLIELLAARGQEAA